MLDGGIAVALVSGVAAMLVVLSRVVVHLRRLRATLDAASAAVNALHVRHRELGVRLDALQQAVRTTKAHARLR